MPAAAEDAFTRAKRGEPVDEAAAAGVETLALLHLAGRYAERGWAMQMHIGPRRNNSSRRLQAVGANTGFDSIDDRPVAEPLGRLLDAMESGKGLPKTILYCVDPAKNAVMATMAGNFSVGGVPGKMQYGSAWWFNDQIDGMRRQLVDLASMGLLSQFVGMLTDSRSFLSFPRHEYFRRILCDLVGSWMEDGEVPPDFDLCGGLVEDVCHRNARRYFGF